MRLDAYQLSMSVCLSSVVNAAKVGFSISQVVLVVSLLGLSAVSIAQASGTSQMRANAIRMPMQLRLNSFARSSMLAVCRAGRSGPCRRRVGVDRWWSRSELLFLPAGHEQPHRRDDEHDDEEQGRGGRRIPRAQSVNPTS